MEFEDDNMADLEVKLDPFVFSELKTTLAAMRNVMGFCSDASLAQLSPQQRSLLAETKTRFERLSSLLDEVARSQNIVSRKIILIVDDEINFVKLLKLQLKVRGHLIVTATDGVMALEKLSVLHPDLIIMDINMPRMNGFEFYQRISSQAGESKYPVLILTSKESFEEGFKKVKAAGFMQKPFLIEDLIKEVDRILYSVP